MPEVGYAITIDVCNHVEKAEVARSCLLGYGYFGEEFCEEEEDGNTNGDFVWVVGAEEETVAQCVRTLLVYVLRLRSISGTPEN